MSIIYEIGDIINSQENIIAHGCNAQRKMASGVAKALRNKWPEATWKPYSEAPKLSMGSTIPGITRCGEKIIFNCITQEMYGYDGKKYVSYDAIHDCFSTINDLEISEYGTCIAIPRIGAGLGGGSWEVIEKIILSTVTNYKVKVYDLP